MAQAGRKMIDCRNISQQTGCTLSIAGTEQEVLDTAVLHAVNAHGHKDTPELREMLRRALEPVERGQAA